MLAMPSRAGMGEKRRDPVNVGEIVTISTQLSAFLDFRICVFSLRYHGLGRFCFFPSSNDWRFGLEVPKLREE